MRIVVLLKQVPDTWGERRLDPATLRVDRSASPAIIDEIGERALDVALRLRDAGGAEIVAVTMGPERAGEVLRTALALGVDSAVHVTDAGLAGADAAWTAAVLTAAVRELDADLVLTGNESTDGRGGVVAAMIAESLGWPLLGSVDSLELADGGVRGERPTETEVTTVTAPLPAVAAITERAGEPRFPSFRGLIGAKKKPIRVVAPSELGLADGERARSVVTGLAEREGHGSGVRIIDDGTAGEQLVEILTREHLV